MALTVSAEDLSSDFAGLPGAAIVTGGSGGVGSQVCRALVARGSSVLLTYRGNRDAAEKLVSVAPDEIVATRTDLGDPAAAQRAVDEALARFGGVHTLVHAAGVMVPQVHVSTVEAERFRYHLLAEAQAFFHIASAALPALRESSGSIVAVTTVATRRFPARDVLSSSPKAAIEALVRALAVEEGRYGVRANCVGPGILRDGMTERLVANGDMHERAFEAALSRIPLRRLGQAVNIAEAVCFLASPRAAYITGQKLDVDGGYSL